MKEGPNPGSFFARRGLLAKGAFARDCCFARSQKDAGDTEKKDGSDIGNEDTSHTIKKDRNGRALPLLQALRFFFLVLLGPQPATETINGL